jgi:branched-subunit amino acid aminotransferase/4-amino-4-deoxychorismate lyase
MKRVVDGKIVPAAAKANEETPADAAGVFETMLLRAGRRIFWSEHWARFAAGCRWLGFEPPAGEKRIVALADELVAANGIPLGVLRLCAWRTDASVTWRMDATAPRPHMARPAFRVQWGPLLPSPAADRAYKHLRRQAWLDALAAARAGGADEALLCDESGRLVEGCVSNLFFVRDEMLHTPNLCLGPLPGIMRAQVLALAISRGWPVIEGEYDRGAIATATEVWLTNSLIGVRPVSAIAERRLPENHPWLDRLRTAWHEQQGWDPVVIG